MPDYQIALRLHCTRDSVHLLPRIGKPSWLQMLPLSICGVLQMGKVRREEAHLDMHNL